MNLVLIGYRCTGKTSVGRLLADECGRSFYDSDDETEKRCGTSIASMVRQKGWDFFRAQEKVTVRELSGRNQVVIATGGGAVLEPENIALLKEKGFLIWLKADADTIMGRLQADQRDKQSRPSLTGMNPAEETAAVLAERTPLYERAADLSVNTSGKSFDEIVAEICLKYACKEEGDVGKHNRRPF